MRPSILISRYNGLLFCVFRFRRGLENPADASATLEVLVIGGVPLNEPIARYGPFVMNTEAEINQAFEDYRRGRMGAINS